MRCACAAICLFALTLSGCYNVPFKKPEMVALGNVDPADVRKAFAGKLADRYETADTVIFRFFWKEIATLGYTRVDRPSRVFEAVCLNHMGVPLFRVGGDREGNRLRYALPELKRIPGFTDHVADDMRRISFDLTPSPSAAAEVLSDRVIFREKRDRGTMEYVFGGRDVLLLKKRYIEGRRERWSVSFYEYASVDGYVYPRGVVLHNRDGRYRLISKTRNIMPKLETRNPAESSP